MIRKGMRAGALIFMPGGGEVRGRERRVQPSQRPVDRVLALRTPQGRDKSAVPHFFVSAPRGDGEGYPTPLACQAAARGSACSGRRVVRWTVGQGVHPHLLSMPLLSHAAFLLVCQHLQRSSAGACAHMPHLGIVCPHLRRRQCWCMCTYATPGECVPTPAAQAVLVHVHICHTWGLCAHTCGACSVGACAHMPHWATCPLLAWEALAELAGTTQRKGSASVRSPKQGLITLLFVCFATHPTTSTLLMLRRVALATPVPMDLPSGSSCSSSATGAPAANVQAS
eukprot:365224-Chlamydomonas_euryale.AAC.11